MTMFDDISRWVAAGESEELEFKATTGQRTEAARSLSAMLNGRGGQVLFGVQPNGTVVGQQVGARTLEDITQASRAITPWYPPSIDRIPIPGGAGREVIVVSVEAGRNKPYSYDGRYYVRSGSATVDMPEELLVRLILERAHEGNRWELSRARCGFEAIDEDELSAFCVDAVACGRARFEAGLSVADILRALRLLDREGNPNQGAIALFGRTEVLADEYPALGCRLLAIAGTKITDEIRDDVLLEGNVFSSLRRAVSFCEEHLNRPMKIEGLYARTWPEVPLDVIREALANAFGHRDYTISGRVQVRVFYDRIEVWSPGRLPFGIEPADLYEPHDSNPWNPHMFASMYRRGLVEQFGSGTLRMATLCREAGIGRPVFVARGASVACHIPRWGYWLAPDGSSVRLGAAAIDVLAILSEGPAARGRIAARLGTFSEDVRETLVRLSDMGLVRVEGHGRGAYWMLSNG